MLISDNKAVLIEYTLTNQEGKVLDTSKGRAPLAYLHGKGNIIPGLEKELEGKKAGDKFKVTILPALAYGEHDPKAVQQVPKNVFGSADVKVGMQFRAQSEHGTQVVTVTKIDGDTVTVDGNHELAGVTLTFDVSVTSVREATKEELAHGHVHGPADIITIELHWAVEA